MKNLFLTAFVASTVLLASCDPESKDKVTPAVPDVGKVASIECAEDMTRMEFEYDASGRISRIVELDIEEPVEELIAISYVYSDSGVRISFDSDEEMTVSVDCTMDNGRITGGSFMGLIPVTVTYDAANYLKSFALENEMFGMKFQYVWTDGCITECTYGDDEETYKIMFTYGTTPAVWGGVDLGWLFLSGLAGDIDLAMAPFGLLGNRNKYLPEKIMDDGDLYQLKPQFDKSGCLTSFTVANNATTYTYKVGYGPKAE